MLVSVCIPTHNAECYISATLQSLLNQTYKAIEIIVVDDGSDDKTSDIVSGYSDKRLKLLRQNNKGAAVARNIAYEHSSGDFIKFMDADDLLNQNHISAQVERLSADPRSISSAKWGRFYNNDESTFKFSPEKVWRDMGATDWLIESLVDSGGNMMQPGLFLIPRKTIEKSGLWNEELSLIDDFEFMCRIMVNSESVFFCQDAVLKYRSGINGSLSSLKERAHMESACKSLELGLSNLLSVSDSKRARLAAANAFQRWAYKFYPDHMDLFEKSQAKVRELGGATVAIEGGRLQRYLSKIFGWQKAVHIHRLLRG